MGTGRKYEYKGLKKITSIRLSEEEKKLILKNFETVQEFIQECLEKLKEKEG